MEHIVFEVGLALTLIAAAALLSARLRFSVVPFLILAGLVVGPHMPKLGIRASGRDAAMRRHGVHPSMGTAAVDRQKSLP
jgi:Kef-type K+ transport system membrane component KefB